jgi:hypothetical protein
MKTERSFNSLPVKMSYLSEEIVISEFSPSGRPLDIENSLCASYKSFKDAIIGSIRAKNREKFDGEESRMHQSQSKMAAKFRDDLMKLVGPESWKNISNLIEKNKSNNFGLHFLVCAPGPKAVRKFSPTFPDSVSSVVVVANEKDSWNHSEINR